MTPSEAEDRIDKRAKAIHEVVQGCWKLLSDLTIEDKAVALDRLTTRLAMEEATNDPSVIKGQRH